MRAFPTLPDELNELIFAIQDGHLFEVVHALRRSYEQCPWWAFFRRRRLLTALFWLTVVCEAYRTGVSDPDAIATGKLAPYSPARKKNHNT